MEQIPLNPNNNISHNFNSALSLKDFDLIEKLGSGAHASVFKAKHKQTGKIYALKEISQTLLDRKDKEIDFIREISILYDFYMIYPSEIVHILINFMLIFKMRTINF